MTSKSFVLIAVLLLAFCLGANAQQPLQAPAQTPKVADQYTPEHCLNKLHAANQAAIQSAQLATTRSKNAEVTQFANMMLREHRQADVKVMELAKSRDIMLKQVPISEPGQRDPGPAAAGAAQTGQQLQEQSFSQELESLRNASAADFDREYTTWVARSHAKLLTELNKSETKLADADVKKLISELKPGISQHQRRAAELSRQFGGEPDAIEDDRTKTD